MKKALTALLTKGIFTQQHADYMSVQILSNLIYWISTSMRDNGSHGKSRNISSFVVCRGDIGDGKEI